MKPLASLNKTRQGSVSQQALFGDPFMFHQTETSEQPVSWIPAKSCRIWKTSKADVDLAQIIRTVTKISSFMTGPSIFVASRCLLWLLRLCDGGISGQMLSQHGEQYYHAVHHGRQLLSVSLGVRAKCQPALMQTQRTMGTECWD